MIQLGVGVAEGTISAPVVSIQYGITRPVDTNTVTQTGTPITVIVGEAIVNCESGVIDILSPIATSNMGMSTAVNELLVQSNTLTGIRCTIPATTVALIDSFSVERETNIWFVRPGINWQS